MQITHIYNDNTKTFEISNFDETKKEYENWLAEKIHFNTVIDGEETFKLLYKERTLLNKEIKALKADKRLINNVILGNFNNNCSDILEMLEGALDKLNETLETYKPKEETYEISYKTKSKEKYDKIMNFINELDKGE